MRQLIWSKSFVRAYKRNLQRYPHLESDIERVLRVLVENPFDAQLRTHKLKGKLEGIWACSVAYDCRLVFEFIKSPSKEDDIFLIEIGTHEEVY
jgi:addiction module RelE/StbE family toxin